MVVLHTLNKAGRMQSTLLGPAQTPFARLLLPPPPRPPGAVNIGSQLPHLFRELPSAEQQPPQPQMTALPQSQSTANNGWTQAYKECTFASKWDQPCGTIYAPELPREQTEADRLG